MAQKIMPAKGKKKDPFQFEIDGTQFQLPAIQDLPNTVRLAIATKVRKERTDENAGFAALSVLSEYMERRHADLWDLLETKSEEGEDYLGLDDEEGDNEGTLLHAWFAHSELDPKASSSATSSK